MSTAALLDADFGSESEDDNFNPAPVDGSDNDGAAESEGEDRVRPKSNGQGQRQSSTQLDPYDEENDPQASLKSRTNGKQSNGHSRGHEDEEDGSGVEDAGKRKLNPIRDEDEEDEEDEDEDDDEEEAVTVCLYWVGL